MDTTRWRRVRDLFERAVELEPGERAALLARECSDDAGLRLEVESLLTADAGAQQDATDFAAKAQGLLADVAERAAQDEAARWTGRRLGPWQLEREIGRGGMGAVWLAHRADGEYDQRVAIKLMRAGYDGGELALRFRAEREILASLDHPNIARLIDAGMADDGSPYLALEYVDGEPITAFCDRTRLGIEARLRLFLAVCAAVTHAHQRLVVHRDLKPSNILVTAEGRVRLLDFGIAKLLGSDAAATGTGLQMFTPEYAAPEQIRGELATTAVDVYALGVLLYELLSGRRPYHVLTETPQAWQRAVLEQEPTRPSAAITRRGRGADASPEAIGAARLLAPQRLRQRLRGDLDAIALKALRKNSAARHESVQRFADDVGAYLDHRPVSARRGSATYIAVQWLRRHALAASLASLAAASLIAGMGIALWQAREARAQRDAARLEATKSREVLAFMSGIFELADPDEARGQAITAQQLLARGTERMRGALLDQPEARAELLGAIGSAHAGLGLYAESLPMLDEALALARATGSRDQIATAELHRSVALAALGRTGDVIAALRPLHGTFTPETPDAELLRAQLGERLAMALQVTGEHAEAERLYQATLATQARLLPPDDRRAHSSAMRYVSLLIIRGRHDEARALAQRTVASIERSTGPDDPHRAAGYASLALALMNTSDSIAAEPHLRAAIDIFERAHGPEHPETISARNVLGGALFGQKRYAEATELYASALAALRSKFGPDHPRVATAAANLAWCHISLGEGARALPLAQDAHRIRHARYGDSNAETATAVRALAAAELLLDLNGDAERHARLAVAGFDAALGPNHRLVLGSISDLTRAMIANGTPDPGCSNARRGYVLGRGDQPGETLDQIYQRGLLGACLVRNGDPVAGRGMLRDSARRIAVVAGPNDGATSKLNRLAQQLEVSIQMP